MMSDGGVWNRSWRSFIVAGSFGAWVPCVEVLVYMLCVSVKTRKKLETDDLSIYSVWRFVGLPVAIDGLRGSWVTISIRINDCQGEWSDIGLSNESWKKERICWILGRVSKEYTRPLSRLAWRHQKRSWKLLQEMPCLGLCYLILDSFTANSVATIVEIIYWKFVGVKLETMTDDFFGWSRLGFSWSHCYTHLHNV